MVTAANEVVGVACYCAASPRPAIFLVAKTTLNGINHLGKSGFPSHFYHSAYLARFHSVGHFLSSVSTSEEFM